MSELEKVLLNGMNNVASIVMAFIFIRYLSKRDKEYTDAMDKIAVTIQKALKDIYDAKLSQAQTLQKLVDTVAAIEMRSIKKKL